MDSPNLLKFQRDAVEELLKAFVQMWKRGERKLSIVFQSPTGSGKTLMAAHFIRSLNHLPNWDEDKALIWITFSDDLAMQSKAKFREYFANNLENNLLTVQDINKGKLGCNEILFLNWQKVVSQTAENRVLRRPDDDTFHKESGSYFEDFIDGTKADGREIILVVDEAHKNKGTRLAQNIIDYIDPKIIIHITATPDEQDELIARRSNSFISVDRKRAVEEGLIKEKIVLQSEEDLKQYGGKDLDEVLLELGYRKREELKAEFQSMGKRINPLVLIQLPNDDKELIATGDKSKEEVVCEYLKRIGVKNHRIAKWFTGVKEDGLGNPIDLRAISDNDDEFEYLLFKEAAGTGWDCPRAIVLIMFREIKSNKFYVQTVGRILRMPEPNLKDDYLSHSNLRIAYLYTNYRRNQVEIPDQSASNKPFTQFAERKQNVENISIRSDFLSRIGYGDIPRSLSFQKSFRESMNRYFKIGPNESPGKASTRLMQAGIATDRSLTNQVIADAQFEDFDQLAFDFVRKGIDVSVEMSVNDVEKTFNYLCYQLLKEQDDELARYSNIARSWSVLKSAIRIWLRGIFGDDSDYYYRVFVRDIQMGPSSRLKPAITNALRDFKPVSQMFLTEKRKQQEQKEVHMFTILDEYKYTDDYQEVPQKLCVLKKLFLLPSYVGRENEIKFKEYLDVKKKEIDWWFKNGNQGKDYFALKYWNSEVKQEGLFYPDWIIRFKDGRLGIFDTKSGSTASSQETKDKAAALSLKMKQLGRRFVGGIAVLENGIWYYNDSAEYEYVRGKSVNSDKRWKKLEDLI